MRPPNAPNTDAADAKAAPLAAPTSTLRSLALEFRKREGEPVATEILVAMGATAAVLAGFWLIARRVLRTEPRKACNDPRRLFKELCRAHGLRPGQRRLLVQLAKARGLSSPGQIFVAPEQFDSANLDATLRRREGELANLRLRLFGEALAP